MSAHHLAGERCGGDKRQNRSSRMRKGRRRETRLRINFFCFAFSASIKKKRSEFREEALDVIELTRQSWRGKGREDSGS